MKKKFPLKKPQKLQKKVKTNKESNFDLNPTVSSFDQIPSDYSSELNLNGFPISDWDGIQKHNSLKKLNVSNTYIANFKNDNFFPPISEIYLEKTPLSKLPFYKEMTVLAFGFQLKKINGVFLEDDFLQKIKQIENLEEIQEKIKEGYVISQIKSDFQNSKKQNVLFADYSFNSTTRKSVEKTQKRTAKSVIDFLNENQVKPYIVAAKTIPFLTRKCELYLRNKENLISSDYQLKINHLEMDMKDKEEMIAEMDLEFQNLQSKYMEITRTHSKDSILINHFSSNDASQSNSIINTYSNDSNSSVFIDDVEKLKERLYDMEKKYNGLLEENESLRQKHAEFLKLFNSLSESTSNEAQDIPIDSLVSLPL